MNKVIEDYGTVDEFWSDFELINQGKSNHTYWDTYENGQRRKLESSFSKEYGSESALLLNTGMSAVFSSVIVNILKSSSKLLTSKKLYFETDNLFKKYLSKNIVEIIRVDHTNSIAILKLLKKYKPQICFFETVINLPEVPVLDFDKKYFLASPESLFVIDNSSQSHNTKWFHIIPKKYHSRLLVIESLAKYFTDEAMGGIIYGNHSSIEKIRDFARNTGQQLQQRAIDYISIPRIKNISNRLSKININIQVFKEIIEEYISLFEYVNFLNSKVLTKNQKRIFATGKGALVYLKIRWPPNFDEDSTNRKLINLWKNSLKDKNIDLKIRAGFGFDITSVRNYEKNQLNQIDTPKYIRISVGTENTSKIEETAKVLIANIKKLLNV